MKIRKNLILSKSTLILLFLFMPFVLAGCWPNASIEEVKNADTIVTKEGGTIRLIGVDVPKLDSPISQEVRFAKDAFRLTRKMTEKKEISFRTDDQLKNEKGEFLMYVNTKDGRSVNSELLRQGLAWHIHSPPNKKFDRDFIKAQKSAMSNRKGLWQEWKTRPDTYRASSKDKRFHHPSCLNGWSVPAKNLKTFQTRWDGFWEGYAPGDCCRYKLMWLGDPPVAIR